MADATDDNNSSSESNHSPKPTNVDDAWFSQTASEKFYVTHGHSLKALSIPCQGLVDEEGDPLINTSILPWSSTRKTSDIEPTAIVFRAKVLGWSTIASNVLIAPCPKALMPAHACEWLNEHPINGEDDIAFIKKQSLSVSRQQRW